ncbi:PorP/SprF family type IX secretion system membrane protein [Saccharicrinis sp. FJH54]|uniref:PorP/SprF family type IX secretion system membrane protein n=1 Tax=Saccharicrinis sp. FJH54 TaxID=3344665 RepID=UPI0035D4E301
MRKILITLIFLSAFSLVKGQYELQFNQLIKSVEFINPGYNAIQKNITSTIIYTNQWNGFPGSPTTAVANIHVPLKSKHLGFGALFTNESLGHRDLRTGGVTVDADIRIGASSYLTLGIMGGYQLIDYNLENATTAYLDQISDIYNYNSTIVGTGVNLFVQRLHFGASGFYQIAPNETGSELTNQLTLYSNVSYWFRLDDAWRLKLAGLYKTRGNYSSIYEGGAFFLFKDIAWLGLSYRMKSAAITMLDVKLSDFIRIGYSYAMGVGELANFTGSSHEIQLHITIPERNRKSNLAEIK